MNQPEELDLFGEPMMRRDAKFGAGGRILLSRDWLSGPRACVIGCNPSNANAVVDDPTSRWWNAWFKLFGFGGYDAVNLYPFCTSDPAECRKIATRGWSGLDWGARDAMQANASFVAERAKTADQVFVCWGAIAWDGDWIDHVVEAIQYDEEPWPVLWCWGKTASGAPKHPLARGRHRIARNQAPVLWKAK